MANRLPDNAFTSPHVLDPGLRKVARFVPRGYALHRGLKLQRAIMNLMGNAGRIRTVPVAAVNEHVSVRLHRPAGLPDPAPALLWIHGGGTIMGHAAQDDKYLRQLSQRTGVAIAAVEHRLAPEHPYPIPVEDCYAALLWLARQPWVDRIESPSAAPAPAAISPPRWRSGHTTAPTSKSPSKCWYIRSSTTVPAPGATAPGGSCGPNPTTNWPGSGTSTGPTRRGRTGSPEGSVSLPPAWIGVGTLDLFYSESLEYARRLREAGVPVQEEIVPGAFHAFDQIADKAPISAKFFESQCDYLRGALTPSG